jgi:thymidylate synthase (FAD)
MMKNRIQYLDKGFVEVIEHMGSDTLIAMAARASFNEEEYQDDKRNESLINYLVEHAHTTPIEMPSIIFRLKMPIFIARQHMRHRTASINEQSLRYMEHDGDYYVPTKERIKYQHENNKQGSGESLPEHIAETAIEIINDNSVSCWNKYQLLLKAGIAKELARTTLPVNYYTTLVWKMDLHNLLHYLKLRSDPHAQEEIVILSEIIGTIVEELYPKTYSAWVNHKKNSKTFSAKEMLIVNDIVNGKLVISDIEDESYKMGSKRNKQEFLNKFKN